MKRKALQQGCSSKNTETHARELLGAPLSTGFQANAQPDGPQVGLLRASNQPTSTAWLPHRCFHGFICLLQHCVHCLAASQVLSWLHLPPATLRHMPEQADWKEFMCLLDTEPVAAFGFCVFRNDPFTLDLHASRLPHSCCLSARSVINLV